MNSKFFLRLFAAVVMVYFTGMALQSNLIMLVFKPLLVTTLLFYFISATKNIASRIKIPVALALIFSVTGDTLLMFAGHNEVFFLSGLAAFLLAHAFYIISFHIIKITENVEGRWQWAVVVAIYYFFIISIVMPGLGGMKIPVLVYGLVISFMLLVAMLLYDMDDNKTARYLLTGAVFFVLSDSILAVNKFHRPLLMGSWLIMTTYVAAQYLLVMGLARYIVQTKKL